MNCRDVYFQRHWVVFFTGQAKVSLQLNKQALDFLEKALEKVIQKALKKVLEKALEKALQKGLENDHENDFENTHENTDNFLTFRTTNTFQVDNFPQDTNGLEDLFCDSTSEYLTKYSLVLSI